MPGSLLEMPQAQETQQDGRSGKFIYMINPIQRSTSTLE